MASKIKRELKNVVYNYTDAEAMVREATSNDPWGPSTAIMQELAEYTYNVQAYSLVMGMLWKRLNDHGKNWRHVYKALVLLEHLIKTGSHRVSQQCKDNLFSIQTLKDFQYIDKDGKDHGASIRDKSKQLVALLKDDRLLQEERERAMHARDRAADSVGGTADHHRESSSAAPNAPATNAGAGVRSDDDFQLQVALRISKEQADKEAALVKEEEESLKVALALSEAEHQNTQPKEDEEPSNSNVLLDLNFNETADPWGTPGTMSLPPSYESLPPTVTDPWSSVNAQPAVTNQWDAFGSSGAAANVNPFEPLPPLGDSLLLPTNMAEAGGNVPKTRVEDSFLGANAAGLVDLDALLAPLPPPLTQQGNSSNPFGMLAPTSSIKPSNPFVTAKPPAPSLVQLASVNKPYGAGNDFLSPAQGSLFPMTMTTSAPLQLNTSFGAQTPQFGSTATPFSSVPLAQPAQSLPYGAPLVMVPLQQGFAQSSNAVFNPFS